MALIGKLGVGAGLGIRQDLEFFILRLDAALRLHDPARRCSLDWTSKLGRIASGIGAAFLIWSQDANFPHVHGNNGEELTRPQRFHAGHPHTFAWYGSRETPKASRLRVPRRKKFLRAHGTSVPIARPWSPTRTMRTTFGSARCVTTTSALEATNTLAFFSTMANTAKWRPSCRLQTRSLSRTPRPTPTG